MKSSGRGGVWVWLLCGLLFWLTSFPPQCELCDRIAFTVAATQQSAFEHSHPVAPDNCNGICTCCGFFGLPLAGQVLVAVTMAPADAAVEAEGPAFAVVSSVFRPPRPVVS